MRTETKSSGKLAKKMHVDPDLASLLPPLSTEELASLEESVLKEGCSEPISVWADGRKHVALDGHRRHEICEKHGVPYQFRIIKLPDRQAAIDWMIRHQLGRRNLTPIATSYFRGKLYSSQKRQGQRTDRHTSGKNGQKLDTAKLIADNNGISDRKVRYDSKFAEHVDALVGNTSPETRQFVLSPACRLTRENVKKLVRVEAPRQKVVMKALLAGKSFSEAWVAPGEDGQRPYDTKASWKIGNRLGRANGRKVKLSVAIALANGLIEKCNRDLSRGELLTEKEEARAALVKAHAGIVADLELTRQLRDRLKQLESAALSLTDESVPDRDVATEKNVFEDANSGAIQHDLIAVLETLSFWTPDIATAVATQASQAEVAAVKSVLSKIEVQAQHIRTQLKGHVADSGVGATRSSRG